LATPLLMLPIYDLKSENEYEKSDPDAVSNPHQSITEQQYLSQNKYAVCLTATKLKKKKNILIETNAA
jgi:hypothetical protein